MEKQRQARQNNIPLSGETIDCYQIYKNDALNHRLLAEEEEQALGQTVQEGVTTVVFHEQVDGDKNDIQRREIYEFTDEAKKAHSELVTHNLKLPVAIARSFTVFERKLDLIQEGNIGLMTSGAKFDPEKGVRFATYARHDVRQQMKRAIQNDSLIHVPIYIQERRSRIHNAAFTFLAKYGRKPTMNELYELIPTLSKANIQRALRLPIILDHPSSSNLKFHYQSGEPEFRFVNNKRYSDKGIENIIINNDITSESSKLLDAVDPRGNPLINERQKMVLSMRYGFNDCDEHTFEKIAQNLGLTHQRVQQIHKRALEKLRVHILRKLRLRELLVPDSYKEPSVDSSSNG